MAGLFWDIMTASIIYFLMQFRRNMIFYSSQVFIILSVPSSPPSTHSPSQDFTPLLMSPLPARIVTSCITPPFHHHHRQPPHLPLSVSAAWCLRSPAAFNFPCEDWSGVFIARQTIKNGGAPLHYLLAVATVEAHMQTSTLWMNRWPCILMGLWRNSEEEGRMRRRRIHQASGFTTAAGLQVNQSHFGFTEGAEGMWSWKGQRRRKENSK